MEQDQIDFYVNQRKKVRLPQMKLFDGQLIGERRRGIGLGVCSRLCQRLGGEIKMFQIDDSTKIVVFEIEVQDLR